MWFRTAVGHWAPPSTAELGTGDMWFRTEEVSLYRECVVPDVSRTYHFAYLGGHVYSYLQYQYFSDKSLNTEPDVELHNVSRLVDKIDYVTRVWR